MLKLSFSVKGWENYSWQDMVELAIENDYKGIDLCASAYPSYFQKNGEFDKYNAGATLRSLKDKEVRFSNVCNKDADSMRKVIFDMLGIN